MNFSADWLALRAPADRAARDPGLMAQAAAAARVAGGGTPVVVDLGCGTGATAAAFAALLPGAEWRLVDADAGLLARAAAATGGTPFRMDLGAVEALPLAGAHLVTCSALLDLMPAAWVAALARRLAAGGLPFHAALSYDGVMHWSPALPDDGAITAAFNRHQRGDKGLGLALGPDSPSATAEAFRAEGFTVQLADSPWRLGPAEARLQAELVTGIAAAADEAGAEGAEAWAQARRTACGYATCVVGHADVLALRPA